MEVPPGPTLQLVGLGLHALLLEEEVVLAAIRGLMENGYIRRFGATLRHQQSGFEANALVAWAVIPVQPGVVLARGPRLRFV